MRKAAPVAVLLLVMVACGSPPPPTETPAADGPPAHGGTVVIGSLSDVQSWNPYLVEVLDTEQILALIYPSLATEQPDYQRHPPSFAPALAESWTWSEDRLELTLELVPDARWSDGVPITAHDVVFTWQAQTSPEVGWIFSSSKDFIESVEAVDQRTVRVTYTHHYPYQLMDLNDGPIIPAHAWSEIPFEEWGETDWKPEVLAGGPFKLALHTPQNEIRLERNPNYFSAPLPYLDEVVFRIVPSWQGLMTQLLAGGIDFMRSVQPSEIERVRRNENLELVIYDARSYSHLCWNTQSPRLADPAVRTALSTAIDRQTIIDVVYGGFGRPSVGPVLSIFWAFNKNLDPVPFDPNEAKNILAEAGWKDSDGDGFLDRGGETFSIELLAAAENEGRQDIALLVQSDLERIGVKVEPRFVEWGTMMAQMQDGTFDGLVNRWEEPTQIDLEGLWHSAPAGEPTFNFGRYANPEVDSLLAQVSGLTDFAEQKPLLDRIQELIVTDQPYTFLVEITQVTAHTRRLKGARINAATPYFNVDEWYVLTGADSP
jgi:peptide/nickel transport system substrate-binding protein